MVLEFFFFKYPRISSLLFFFSGKNIGWNINKILLQFLLFQAKILFIKSKKIKRFVCHQIQIYIFTNNKCMQFLKKISLFFIGWKAIKFNINVFFQFSTSLFLYPYPAQIRLPIRYMWARVFLPKSAVSQNLNRPPHLTNRNEVNIDIDLLYK